MASLLIDNDININEGMELSRKALEIWPDAYDLLLVKGWGCYKQGKYKEALDILEKSWDLYPFYSTELAFYIQEVKKAVASQKK